MTPTTRIDARRATFGRIQLLAEKYQPSCDTEKKFLEINRMVMDLNPIGEEGTSEEIASAMKMLLPPARTIFTDEFFAQSPFTVRILKDVADLYQCLPLKGDVVSSIDDASLQVNRNAMAFVWLACALTDTKDQAKDLARTIMVRFKKFMELPFDDIDQTPSLPPAPTPPIMTPSAPSPTPMAPTLPAPPPPPTSPAPSPDPSPSPNSKDPQAPPTDFLDDQSFFLTEVLDLNDQRCSTQEMSDAKRKAIKGILDRGTFKVMLKEDIPPDGNVLPGHFILAIKSTEDCEVKFKARYVIGGHRDKMKRMMVHNAQTLQPASIRLLLALAASHGFHVWTSDVRQAYLQSAVPFLRDVYIKDVAPEFELRPDQCLQILKPIYGLCDAGDLWFQTIDNHHRRDLSMKPMRSDPALYVSMHKGKLQGLSGTYVDDMLRAGSGDFQEKVKATATRFDMAEDELPPVTFTGFHIAKDNKSRLTMEKHGYVQRMKPLPTDATFSDFASLRMQLAWLSHTRPDLMYEVSQLTQVTAEMFKTDRRPIIKRSNKTVDFAKANSAGITFIPLDLSSLLLIGFSDASFAMNHDLTSQLGYIILLADASGKAIPVQFKSYKARRIVRSALAAELIAFADMFDVAHTLAEELRTLHPRASLPVKLYTDNKSLFDIISKGSRTSEKRLMLDIAAAREGFKNFEISDIGYVRTAHNLADGLMKAMNQAAINKVLTSGTIHPNVEQWIIRKKGRED